MNWEITALFALVLGLLVKTNLVEDRVKKLGEHGEKKSNRRVDGTDRHRQRRLDEGSHEPPCE